VTFLYDIFATVRDFFDAGGPVLYGVFVTTVVMWSLIVERLWFFRLEMPLRMEEVKQRWAKRTDHTSWYARRIRQQMLSEFGLEASRGTQVIATCVAMAPLFGLLGTVSGMIGVFDVMASLGTGNARAMASGVSRATLPTMSGMVVAVSGIYFASALAARAKSAVDELADELPYH
jgi:biopolymer transport protein ExbB